MNQERRGKRPTNVRKVVGLLSFLIALACWAIASPVGASPDEDFHLASIWCAHGFEPGVCEPGATPDTRRVPAELVRSTCFAFYSERSAACQTERSELVGMVETDRGNFSGTYPPVFYWVAGLFVGDSVNGSVVVVRLVNAALYLGLIAVIYLAVPLRLRGPLIAGALLTAVPLAMFIVPSVNPSSWAMLSAATLLVSVLGFLTAEHWRRRLTFAALSAVSMLLGAGARADAAIFGIIAIGAALILAAPIGKRRALRSLIFPGALVVAALVAFLSAGQSAAAFTWGEGTAEVAAAHVERPFDRIVGIVEVIPALWTGALGHWGLGWLDTEMPPIVWVGSWSVYAATLFLAAAHADRRRAIAIATVGLAAVAVPSYIQWVWGSGVQARYVLPLLAILIAAAAVRLRGPAFWLTRGQRWSVVVVLSLANAIALQTNLRRYVTGTDVSEFNLDKGVEWWWPIAISPMFVWVVGTVAFIVGASLVSADLMYSDSRKDRGQARDDADDGGQEVDNGVAPEEQNRSDLIDRGRILPETRVAGLAGM